MMKAKTNNNSLFIQRTIGIEVSLFIEVVEKRLYFGQEKGDKLN